MENGFNPETPSVSAELRAALELSTDGILVYLPVVDGAVVRYRLSVANTAACNIFRATERSLLRLSSLREIDPDAFWPCCTTVSAPEGAAEPPGWYQPEQRSFLSGFVRIYHNIDKERRASLQSGDRHRFYRSISLQERSRLSVLEPVFDFTGQVIDFRIEFANYGDGIDDSHRAFEPFESDIVGKLVSELQPGIRQTPVWEFYLHCLDSKEPQRTELWYSNQDHSTALEVQGRRLDDGRLLVSYADVSEQHHLSQELESERAWLATLFNNVPVGILILEAVRDEQGLLCDLRMTRRNEMGSRLSRMPQDVFDLKPPLTELLKDDLPQLVPRLLEIVRTGIPFSGEVYQAPLDKWLRGKAIKHGDGLLITLEDVTDVHERTTHIQDQAELLAGVMEATPHATMVFQAIRDEAGAITDFRMLRCNERAAELLYIPMERLLSETMFSWEPEQQDRLPAFRQVIEEREAEVYESYNAVRSRWRRITNTPFKDGFVTTLEDITQQKQDAAKTEEQARLFNAVLNHTPAATAVYQAVRNDSGEITDFKPLLANREALRMVGMTLDEFLGISLWESMRSGAEQTYIAMRGVVETGELLRIEHESVFTGDWLSTMAARFGDGFIASSQDLSEHKKQLRIIEKQALLFNGVMKSLRNGLVIYRIIRDDEGNLEDLEYVQVADSVLRDVGRERHELIGKRIRSVFPGIEGTDYWQAYLQLMATGEDQHFESHFAHFGMNNYLLNWLTPIGSDMMVSAYYIINDLKRAQQEQEYTVRELRRSNEDLEQFASIASHDLQEPLRKVQSFGNMLEARFADVLGAEGKDLVRRMQNAAARMRNLVTGLLSFSRLSGHDEGAFEPVDLHSLMHELAGDLRIAQEGPEPRIEIQGQLPFVTGIESQLRHLFHNLLGNAIKFSGPGVAPEVLIRAAVPTDDGMARLAPGAQVRDFVQIMVQDKGIGFEAEYAEKIFGLFERLHGMSEYQGTGIGLSIARRVVERHQGAIWAEGEPGKGATFTVLLRRP